AKAVAALDVSVAISGEGSSELETGVIEGLNAFGLQALQGASRDADLEVAGRLSSVPMQGDGSQWKWARSNATITLKDGHSGKVVSQFDASDREASSDYGEAVRRSRVELAKLVSGKLSGAITAYFENQ
ncbi:MAG: hypothetical protein KGK30_04390, partial [Elusimicrobia bacterium]|nr:hypothetical protein [Elusimicrobiota bacterium]